MRIKSTSVFFAASLFCVPAGAATISLLDLPAAIQSCISAGDCYLPDNTSAADVGNASVFYFIDAISSAPDSKYLVRYDLVPPSARYGDSDIIDPVSGLRYTSSSTTPLNGYFWLLVNDGYSLASDTHAMTAYLDKITPSMNNIFNSGSVELTLTTTDLLNGSTYRKRGYDGYCSPIDEGSLGVDPEPLLLADCPSWYMVELNLVYLAFTQTGGFVNLDPDSLNPDDARARVFGSSIYWANPFEHQLFTDNYYIQTVPLPPTAWLFIAGLALLVRTARHA